MSKLVDPTFLCFLEAGHSAAATTVRRQADLFAELIGYGWTVEELITAAKTGYNYAAHSSTGRSVVGGNWKAYGNAGAFKDWLRHHYRQMRANETNVSLDEFVALWCKLYDESFFSGGNKYDRSYEALRVYIKALRAELSAKEAMNLARDVFYSSRVDCDLYIALRRKKISRELATRIVTESTVGAEDLKSIVEAHRRGATDDEILNASADRRVHALALRYRQEARERRETS